MTDILFLTQIDQSYYSLWCCYCDLL